MKYVPQRQRHVLIRTVRFVTVYTLTFFDISSAVQSAEFIRFGILEERTGSWARGVSDDGMLVAGSYFNAGGGHGGTFVWTPESGVVPLASLPPGYEMFSLGRTPVSRDGSVVVGSLVKRLPDDSFNRDLAAYGKDGWQILDASPDSNWDEVNAVSHDGSVVVGQNGPTFDWQATIWSASNGSNVLGWLPGYDGSGALDVSANGQIVVGGNAKAEADGELPRAFNGDVPVVWSEPNVIVELEGHGSASDISDDGSVVGGSAILTSSADPQAFRWTEDQGIVGLGWLPGSEMPESLRETWGEKLSGVRAINGDGSVIVGHSGSHLFFEPTGKPFIWTEQSGMQDLQQLLIDEYGLGPDLAGWNLWVPQDISANGQFITGIGINPDGAFEGWLVRLGAPIPEPSSALLALTGSVLLIPHRRRRND